MFLIVAAYYTDTVHVREQGCEDPSLFFEARRGSQTKMFWKHCPVLFRFSILSHKAHIILFHSRQGRKTFFLAAPRPALGPNHPPVQRVLGALYSQESDWDVKLTSHLNKLRTRILNCLNARSRGLTFRHRASCI